MKRAPQNPTQFAVLGLGRFGMSIARTLSEYDVSILVCDRDEAKLADAAEFATHVVRCDVADESAMRQVGIGNFDVVIIAMASDFEGSLMATMLAKESGAGHVVVKARSRRQKVILESVGADQVVLPEYEMGTKIARKLVDNSLLDVFEAGDHYQIAEMHPRAEWIGKTLRQADVRRQHGLTVLAIRRGDKLQVPASPERTLTEADILITLSESHPKNAQSE